MEEMGREKWVFPEPYAAVKIRQVAVEVSFALWDSAGS